MNLDINALLPFLPERWRPLVVATLGAVAASQVLAAQIVARLPSSAANHPTWGRLVHTLHWYSHVRFFDELGTVKPPFSNAPASPPPAAPTPPSGSPGFVAAEVIAVVAMLGVLACAALLTGCPSLPPPSGCTPHAYRCSPDGWPQVCSATQRWTPIGDSACRDVHSVCCSVDSYGAVVSACVPESRCLVEPVAATDGGAL